MTEGYRNPPSGTLLKQSKQLNAGMSQVVVAKKLKNLNSAISRIENNAGDVMLSTLSQYSGALGKKLDISIH
ncbi:MAG: helix-turn-helix transcriptional regulator [Chlorobiaceae bacterium]|jgi:hypothetical protein|nr:helix-turn-helix transcriptional regulator [Chlorobiaceae bacterium]